MPDIDCGAEMRTFHSKQVTLGKAQQDAMRTRRDAGRTRLNSGLDLNKHPQPKEVASQGSYQMRTMIQDADNDYDIDDGAYFEDTDLVDPYRQPLTPFQARERVCEALKWDGRLKHEAEVKRNCVRQPYPEGYHIDVAVYRIVKYADDSGQEEIEYQLASGDQWVQSDARAVTRWYNGFVGELNSGESDGSQMRRVTKLTKRLARSRLEWKTETTSGICISKLVVDFFRHIEARDDQALRETWAAIKAKLDSSTEIEHPVLDTKLAEPGDRKVEFFRGCLDFALETLAVLDDPQSDRAQARAAWDTVFDTTFFSDQPDGDGGDDDDGGKKRASVVITSGETARRNDGGGRFG